ncbi:TQXA domain-containing protein [Mycobacterium parmense]|uniref:TQXA domain-containing protein n=2 Tax=Mycobacterium parmense TaxID=185642 RepID=A0A7I7YN88_9MYCO|nr:TQXA domain-containing protein [Mycobacterium parmense]
MRPATDLSHMTRYRGGTYSHTVDEVVFEDGSSARTDLIRVNPNVDAYSLDFTGIAPHHPSRYALGSWSALPHLRIRGGEAGVDWILRNSFPRQPIAHLSRRVRRAGYPLGPANISEHEAIAATQASIWHFTNGLNLGTRPLNVPVAVRRAPGPVITFEFDGEPQIGGYSVWVASDAEVNLKLQKSANGLTWQDISTSSFIAGAGEGRHRRTLGVATTLSGSSHGRGGRGYRYYRLVATTAAAAVVDHVRFWLTGARHYPNADRIVHLYNYLLSGARKAITDTDELQLVDNQATAEAELIGPFQVPIPLTLSVAAGHRLVDTEGLEIGGIIEPGTDFYLRPAPGASATTMTATTPHGLAGRVLTGVAMEGTQHRLTPIALIVPTDVAIEFDIVWHAEESRTDIA